MSVRSRLIACFSTVALACGSSGPTTPAPEPTTTPTPLPTARAAACALAPPAAAPARSAPGWAARLVTVEGLPLVIRREADGRTRVAGQFWNARDDALFGFQQMVSPRGAVASPIKSSDWGAKRWLVGASFDDAGRAYFACAYGYASPFGCSAWMLDQQGERWERPLEQAYVASIAAARGGGAYVAANDSTPAANVGQAWLVRLTEAGAVSWSAPLGGVASSADRTTPGVAVSPCGDIFVAGLAPVAGDAPGQYSPWVGRWSSAGVQVWARPFGALGEQCDGVAARPQGGAFVLVYRPGSQATVALVRLDDGGDVVWSQELGAFGAGGLQADSTGGVWLALNGTISGSGPVILHVDADGTVVSSSSLPAQVTISALAVDGGGVFVGGNDSRGASSRYFVAYLGATGELPLP